MRPISPASSSSAAPQAEGLARLFGPADAPVAMVRGRHRVRLLVQSPARFRPQRLRPVLAQFGRTGERKSAGSSRYRPDEFLLSGATQGPHSGSDAAQSAQLNIAGMKRDRSLKDHHKHPVVAPYAVMVEVDPSLVSVIDHALLSGRRIVQAVPAKNCLLLRNLPDPNPNASSHSQISS